MTLVEIEAALPGLPPADVERLESVLREMREHNERERREDLYRRLGFRPFENRNGKTVTVEMVRQLCEEEGV